MLDLQQAKNLAQLKLDELQTLSKLEIVIVDEFTMSFEYGWVFFYQSKIFLETENPDFMLGGNAPILVDKFEGSILLTGTGKDIKEYIKIYNQFKLEWSS
jgi:Immunity protein 35